MLEIYSNFLTRKYVFTKYMASRHNEKGASAVEYGLLVALIAAVIVAAVTLLGGTLTGIFTDTNNKIKPGP
jgi:pilus assembly protein Flp/PilA